MTCSAYNCTSRYTKKKAGITLHSFPKDEERRDLWIKAMQRENWMPSKSSKLCSKHFREEDFDRTSLCCVRLREHAVPSIFDGFPPHLKKKYKPPRKAPHPRNLLPDSILSEIPDPLPGVFRNPAMAHDSSIDEPILLMNPRERPEEALYKELSTTLMNNPRIKSEPEDCDTPSAIDSSKAQHVPEEPHCLPMEVPEREAAPNRFPCFMCSAQFPSKSALDTHLLFHSQESPYSCDQCGEGFPQEREMQMHRRDHDRYVQPVVYGLPTRSMPLKNPSNCASHLKCICKLYVCPICSKAFKWENLLRRHYLEHIKKSHFCHNCNKSFATNGALLTHQKKHRICSKRLLLDAEFKMIHGFGAG